MLYTRVNVWRSIHSTVLEKIAPNSGVFFGPPYYSLSFFHKRECVTFYLQYSKRSSQNRACSLPPPIIVYPSFIEWMWRSIYILRIYYITAGITCMCLLLLLYYLPGRILQVIVFPFLTSFFFMSGSGSGGGCDFLQKIFALYSFCSPGCATSSIFLFSAIMLEWPFRV